MKRIFCAVALVIGGTAGIVFTQSEAIGQMFAESIVTRTPIMSLAGTDPARLDLAIHALEATRNRLAERVEPPSEAKYVGTALYPVHFLTMLPQLERARQVFIADSTHENWETYVAALSKSHNAYGADLTAFKAAFEAVVPKDAPTYATANSRVSRDGMLDAITRLEEEHTRRGIEIDRRTRCASGLLSNCRLRDIRTPTISVRAPTGTDENMTQSETIRALITEALPLMTNETPTISMQKGACTKNLPGPSSFFLYTDDASIVPMYLGDIRMIDTRTISVPFYTFFQKHGVTYVPSPTFVGYACPLFSFEFSRLLSLAKYGTRPHDPAAVLAANDSSADFDAVITYVARVANSIMNAADNGAAASFDAGTLFYARSDFLATFAAHNRSITSVETFFDAPPIPLDEQPFVFYTSLPRSSALDTEIRAGIRLLTEVHRATPDI